LKKYWAVDPNPRVVEFSTLAGLRAWAMKAKKIYAATHGHATTVYFCKRIDRHRSESAGEQ